LGFTDILVSAKTADIRVDTMLLYSSRIQKTCARERNRASQDSYLTATPAGVIS